MVLYVLIGFDILRDGFLSRHLKGYNCCNIKLECLFLLECISCNC